MNEFLQDWLEADKQHPRDRSGEWLSGFSRLEGEEHPVQIEEIFLNRTDR